MTALPPHLAADLARVRAALYDAPAGVSVLEAREALDRLEAALRGGQELRGATLALGVKLRGYIGGDGFSGMSTSEREDDLLAAMCDAEERATL